MAEVSRSAVMSGYRLGFRHGGYLEIDGDMPSNLASFLKDEMTSNLDDLDEVLGEIVEVRRGRMPESDRHDDRWWFRATAAGVPLAGDISLAVFETALRRMQRLFALGEAAAPMSRQTVIWETPDLLRLVDHQGREPDASVLDRAPVWTIIAGFDGCVDWPPTPDDEGWQTATQPPVVGRRYEVVVRFPFGAERGGLFWTLFEAAPEAVNGWEHDRPEGPALMRLVRCRYAADVSIAAERATIAVEVVETLSLADLAALPVPAPPDAAYRDYVVSGWAPPLENRGIRVAVGRFEQVTGDFACCLYRTVDPSGGEVLVHIGKTLRSSFFWAGRRALSPEEAAIIESGSDPY